MSWVSDTTLKLQPRLRSRRHAGERGTPTGARCATVTLAHTPDNPSFTYSAARSTAESQLIRNARFLPGAPGAGREVCAACSWCRSRGLRGVQLVQVARFARRAAGAGREVCAACSWCRSAYLPGFSSRYAVLVGSCCTNCAKGACERLGLVDETGVTAGETR